MNSINQRLKSMIPKLGIIIVLFLASCDAGFQTMNEDPNVYNDPVIGSMLSYSIVKTAGAGWDNTNYPNEKMAGAMMQIFASLNPWQWTGGKYLHKPTYTYGFWRAGYEVEVKQITQILALLEDKPEMVNQRQIARIWRVYIFHRITDMYGDAPYFEAGNAYLGENYEPEFTPQSEIYADMLNELEEAAQLLDPSEPSFGSADFLYNGDPVKWKRFAYSLMLRLGMRLTKVDPALAETWVKKAIAGGVMQSNEDNARLQHSEGTINNYYVSAFYMSGGEGVPPSAEGKGYGKMGETFVSLLKSTNDPRLPFYITLWPGNADASKLPASTDPSVQKGLPHGYDYSSIKELIPNWTDDMLAEYSEINLQRVAHQAATQIFQGYFEVELLLAEAALRGWGPGDAQTHYEQAVAASMEIPAMNPGGYSISTADVNDYLAANPYDPTGTFEEQMEQIHTQFYVSLFMNNIEIYANWRRTGYPKLTPTNYPGNATGGTIPRRLRYPENERIYNTENYNEAVQNQGPDLYTTRVWWDKK